MKKCYVLLLAGVLAGACVDSDYDLTDIDTDRIAVGDETSEFKMPLATVKVSMREIAADGTDIEAIFAEADVWLPTAIPGGSVDIPRLTADATYVDELLDELSAEMMTSDAKMHAVTDLVWDKYRASFLPLLPGITGNETAEQFYDAFSAAFRTEPALRELLNREILSLARGYLTTLHVDDLRYEVDGIDIGSDVVDMLAKNLDPDAKPGMPNTLCLYGEIRSKLPVSLHLKPLFSPTTVTCEIDVQAGSASNAIPQTQLFEEDLRQIVRGMTILIPVTLTEYHPGMGFDKNSSEPQIELSLRLRKLGGLTLDI